MMFSGEEGWEGVPAAVRAALQPTITEIEQLEESGMHTMSLRCLRALLESAIARSRLASPAVSLLGEAEKP